MIKSIANGVSAGVASAASSSSSSSSSSSRASQYQNGFGRAVNKEPEHHSFQSFSNTNVRAPTNQYVGHITNENGNHVRYGHHSIGNASLGSSGYDTMSIGTLHGMHPQENSHNTSGSSGSVSHGLSITKMPSPMATLPRDATDSMYTQLGEAEINNLMNEAVVINLFLL